VSVPTVESSNPYMCVAGAGASMFYHGLWRPDMDYDLCLSGAQANGKGE